MRSEALSFSNRMIVACAFLGAVVFGFAAFTFVRQIVCGAGTPAGNVFRAGAAGISLFMGIFFATVGTVYHKSFDEDRGRAFR